MDPLAHWQHLQRQGNQAFRQAQWQLASEYYLHSIILIRHHLPLKLHQQKFQPQSMLLSSSQATTADLVICLSIAIRNLAEVYARQQRWRRCHSLLKRALSRLQLLQQQLDAIDNASVVLLQECCSLRREIYRHTLSCNASITKTPTLAMPMLSSHIH